MQAYTNLVRDGSVRNVLSNDVTGPEGATLRVLSVSNANGQSRAGDRLAGTYGRIRLYGDGSYIYATDGSTTIAAAPKARRRGPGRGRRIGRRGRLLRPGE